MPTVRLGSRKSRLAVLQTERVAAILRNRGFQVEIVCFDTHGDRVQDVALSQIGRKGAFTVELEESLLSGKIHAAVHSLKDLTVKMPEGLLLAACMERDDRGDSLVMPSTEGFVNVRDLPQGSVVGTSSPRREALLGELNPSLRISSVRGNIQTRLKKLLEGPYDALVMASAAVERLQLEKDNRICIAAFDPHEFPPAVGQGCIAVQCAQDCEFLEVFRHLDHAETRLCCELERSILRALGGGCSLPLGVDCHVQHESGMLQCHAIYFVDGYPRKASLQLLADEADPLSIGSGLAQQLNAPM